MKDQIQSVWLTFDDGTKAGFTGRAVAFPGDKRHITDIKFTIPKPMPPGCSFEPLTGDKMVWEREKKP